MRGPLIHLSYHQVLVQFVVDLPIANLVVIVGIHLYHFILAKTVWQTLLVSGDFDVLHSDVMLNFVCSLMVQSMRLLVSLF
jgi:hypothetical protein